MDTSLGPRLEALGPVPALHLDFVRLAAMVFFCDRTTERPRSFRRTLDIDVAVSDPTVWRCQAPRIEAILAVLTGDAWHVEFSRRREPKAVEVSPATPGDVCVLFSGGADSACGAITAASDNEKIMLVSHHDWTCVRGQQRRVLSAIQSQVGGELTNLSWRLARKRFQVGSGDAFGEERSRRSRSIVFVALGVAVAAMGEAPLWIAENGFTSLNPPLSAERRGAMSTRTTHPTVLEGFRQIMGEVGMNADLLNPFADITKGEMFKRVRSKLGADLASEILSTTNSCAKPSRVKGFAPDAHCGVCMGCLVRRAAFLAAGLRDQTEYVETALIGDSRRDTWLSPARKADYEALRARVEIGYSMEDILELGLPDEADIDAALDLANTGLAELALVRID